MISRPTTYLLLAATLASTSPQALPAQQEATAAASETLEQRIDKAIADYEAVRSDKDKVAQRRRFLTWLGELDDERVTAYLKRELKAQSQSALGDEVIVAIGKVGRPELEPDLLAVLKHPRTPQAARNAAAAVLCGFGESSCDEMIDLVAGKKKIAAGAVRNAVLRALARVDSARMHRGLVELLGLGDNPERLDVLRNTASVRGVTIVDNARIQCIREGNLIVAAAAWRILAEQGHARARSLTIDVLERIIDEPDAPTAAELVRGLAVVGDPDFYPALLRFGSIRGREVAAARKVAAPNVAKDPALLSWLIENGLDAETPAERDAAKHLLLRAPAEALQPLVERVRKQLRRNRKSVLETAAGLHELLAKDPTWQQDLAELAAERDLESRMLGLALLMEMGSTAGVAAAQDYVDNRAWELRSLCFRYLTRCRDVTSIPVLIARYEKEEGRLAHELDQALFVHTGTRCWTRRNWQDWWREHKDGFELPHPNTVKGGSGSGGGTTVSYYDIPLVSSRIAFIVDHSGSMRASIGTDKKHTRLDAAKEQLRLVLEALPKTHEVNLIPFETNVKAIWSDLQKLTPGNRKDLLEAVKVIPFGGGTNTYGALERAFEDPDVDTIYLLTDGVPTSGPITDPDEIVDEIRYINRTRQIVIHCISIGLDSDLLKRLAEQTGGQYKYVR